jgi:hypothetical protein
VQQPQAVEANNITTSNSASFSPIPVRLNQDVQQGQVDEPIKIELSLTPEMLKSVASGTGNIAFVVQGVQGLHQGQTSVSATFASSLLSSAPAQSEADHATVVKSEPEDVEITDAVSENLSDEELIAMLVQCAGTEPASQGPLSTGSSSLGGGLNTELSDAEIMQALAGCCQAPSAFGLDSEDALGDSSSSENGHEFMGFDGDEEFHSFSDLTCGGQYVDMTV